MYYLSPVSILVISIFLNTSVPVSAQDIVENFDGDITYTQPKKDEASRLSIAQTKNIVVNLAVSRLEELEAALRLSDVNESRFEELVGKARRNRSTAQEALRVARALNLNDLQTPIDDSQLIEDAIKSEADIAAEFRDWITSLSLEQQEIWVKLVAQHVKGIDFIRVPFVSSFLKVDKAQASRLQIAFAKRDRDLQRLMKTVTPGSRPSGKVRLQMIGSDAKIYHELTLQQLDKSFRVLGWVEETQTTKDFIAKLSPPARDALIENATNLQGVWKSMDARANKN